jgi:hypothetical protein
MNLLIGSNLIKKIIKQSILETVGLDAGQRFKSVQTVLLDDLEDISSETAEDQANFAKTFFIKIVMENQNIKAYGKRDTKNTPATEISDVNIYTLNKGQEELFIAIGKGEGSSSRKIYVSTDNELFAEREAEIKSDAFLLLNCSGNNKILKIDRKFLEANTFKVNAKEQQGDNSSDLAKKKIEQGEIIVKGLNRVNNQIGNHHKFMDKANVYFYFTEGVNEDKIFFRKIGTGSNKKGNLKELEDNRLITKIKAKIKAKIKE